MSAAGWVHPLEPAAADLPAVLPLSRTSPAALARRVLWCRSCGQDCGTPGAVLCDACWRRRTLERRPSMTNGPTS